jgi:hypothetical protein
MSFANEGEEFTVNREAAFPDPFPLALRTPSRWPRLIKQETDLPSRGYRLHELHIGCRAHYAFLQVGARISA